MVSFHAKFPDSTYNKQCISYCHRKDKYRFRASNILVYKILHYIFVLRKFHILWRYFYHATFANLNYMTSGRSQLITSLDRHVYTHRKVKDECGLPQWLPYKIKLKSFSRFKSKKAGTDIQMEIISYAIKHRGRVFSNSAWYSRDTGFKSWCADHISRHGFRGLPQSFHAKDGTG